MSFLVELSSLYVEALGWDDMTEGTIFVGWADEEGNTYFYYGPTDPAIPLYFSKVVAS